MAGANTADSAVIEQARIEDLAEILALQKTAYQSEAELHQDFTIPPLLQTLDQMEDDLNNQVMLKAVLDGRIIGSVRAFEQNGTCFIGRLIVEPAFQNRGLGTRLMAAIEDAFRRAPRFELFTGHNSPRNMHFYPKLGYAAFKKEKLHEHLTLVYFEKKGR